jgi:FkbM family methyltransferase
MTNPFLVDSEEAFTSWLTAKPPALAFDIGANAGRYTETLLRHGAQKVVAFEPIPSLATALRARFAGESRVEVRQIAMGENTEKREDLSVLNCWTLANKDKTPLEPSPDFRGQTFEIWFNFIDSGVFGYPDFVKLDADGYEPAILRGAVKLIQAKRPAFLLELSYIPQDLGDSCDRMVYEMYVNHRYVFVSQDAKFVCRHHREMLSYFPWNTSYDVLAIPEEQISVLFPF